MSVVFPLPHTAREIAPVVLTAGQTDVPCNFGIQSEHDIEVWRTRNGARTLLSLSAFAYEVHGVDNPSGFTVRILDGTLAGDQIEVIGKAELNRETSVSQGNSFSAKAVDREFDRTRIIQQELRRDIDAVTPDLATRAGGVQFYNSITGDVETIPLELLLSGNWDDVGLLADRGQHDLKSVGFRYLAIDQRPLWFSLREGPPGGWSRPYYLSNTEDASRFTTRAAAIAASIPLVVDIVTTLGFATIGDNGAARYKRVSSNPGNTAAFQDARGQWWDLAEATPKAAHFGVAGNANYTNGTGGADDTAALNSFAAYLSNSPYLRGELIGYAGNQFRTTAPWELHPNTIIEGAGFNCFLWSKHAGAAIKPYRSTPTYDSAGGIIAGSALRINGVVLCGFQIDGDGGAEGVSLENASDWRVTNVNVRNSNIAFHVFNSVDPADVLDAANYNIFFTCAATQCAVGYTFDLNCNSNSLFACRTNNCVVSMRDYGNNNAAIRCQFESGTNGVEMRSATPSWLSGTTYATYNFVLHNGNTYRCVFAHTATVFATDLAAGKWIFIGAGGYYSYGFISDGNRFEGIVTAHLVFPGAIQPIIRGNFYSNVQTDYYEYADLGNGNQAQIFGTEGFRVGSSGSYFKQIREVALPINFGTIGAGASVDIDILAPLAAACPGYAVASWFDVMVSALPGGILYQREPGYIRMTNITSSAIFIGSKNVRALVWTK